ncbi:MAG TPA: DUF4229 domain-containing protein [Actinophytocola sp.]|uniref:DUF4229 domain-containing protein n=1 Tax=Actinophytocola sp. TaxID=1872138 RepID=UPI002DBD7BE1|nr:DUF4229 domain-containing protein [Actinophytocola sp.]HEU5472003.1 DUF4229 domain-containing protein [Actinophytocola sp.]
MADGHLGRDLALYTLARIGLVAAVGGLLLLFGVPLLVSLAVAIVAGFPLGLLLFRGLNQRVTASLAARGAARSAERDRLRAQLRGADTPPAEDDGR